jgi:hypothetical protein
MTWVVYLLLALNLSLLTWNLHTRTATGTVATAPVREQASGTVNQLPLLTELDEDALRPRPTAIPVPAVTADPPRPASVAGQASPVTTNSKSDPVTAGAGEAATTTGLATPIDVDRSAAAAVPGPAGVATAAAQNYDTVVSATALRSCLTLGPLSANAPVEEMRTWFEQAGASVDVRRNERREVTLYWVYFPPRTTRKIAVAEVARLRSEGLTDVVAVPKGDMTNAISLGVFSRTGTRDRRVKQMNQRGYQPSVAPLYRTKLATWVDVSASADILSDQDIQTRWPAFQLSRKPCSGEPVASGPLDAVRIAVRSIAVQPVPSYNASPSAPRRFHFSGVHPRQSSGTSR